MTASEKNTVDNRGYLTLDPGGRPLSIETRWYGRGRKENPVLVFLHEGLGCIASWKDIPSALSRATQCRAFAYSRPGYGGSGPVDLPRKINYLHVEALKVLPMVLKAAGIRTYILIGHSDGGSMGIIHAGRPVSQGLKGLVTLAAHLFCEPVTLEGIRRARSLYLGGSLGHKLKRLHGNNTEAAFWGWNDTWLAPGFAQWNIEKFLKFVRVDVLALQGKEDPYGTRAQLDAMAAGLHTCEIGLLKNCGHAPHLEKREETLDRITAFVHRILA